MDKNKPAICVFCGSSFGVDPRYGEAARQTGRLIGTAGFSLVFGGGDVGLMGEVARQAHLAGAGILGILPDFLRHAEPPLRGGETIHIVPDFFARKAQMIASADAFLVLPGGIGTLDELAEVLTTANLDRHAKPIVLVDEDYHAPLMALIDHFIAQGFAGSRIRTLLKLFPSPDDAINYLKGHFSREGH